MRSVSLVAFSLFERAAYGVSSASSLLRCNADNCLNVMTNTPSVGSSFCSTFLQPTTVVTVTPTMTISGSSTITPTVTASSFPGAPAHISSQCVLNTATPLATRLSSACSCLAITPSPGTVTSTFIAAVTTTNLPTVLPGVPTTCGINTPYTSPDGDVFDVTCGRAYEGYYASAWGVPDFPTCVDWCSEDPACVGSNYEASDNGLCTKSDTLLADDLVVFPELAVALLRVSSTPV